MIQIGDRVTGTPGNPVVKRKYPSVTGIYDRGDYDAEGTQWSVHYVILEDGELIDCSSVRPAGRRETNTPKVVA